MPHYAREPKGAAFLHKKTLTDEIEGTVNWFQGGKLSVLIMTDDVLPALLHPIDQRQSISAVVNYEMPASVGSYQMRAKVCGKKPSSCGESEEFAIFNSKIKILGVISGNLVILIPICIQKCFW